MNSIELTLSNRQLIQTGLIWAKRNGNSQLEIGIRKTDQSSSQVYDLKSLQCGFDHLEIIGEFLSKFSRSAVNSIVREGLSDLIIFIESKPVTDQVKMEIFLKTSEQYMLVFGYTDEKAINRFGVDLMKLIASIQGECVG